MYFTFTRTVQIYSVSQKWVHAFPFLQIFKYISSWDNTDKMTLWYNEK